VPVLFFFGRALTSLVPQTQQVALGQRWLCVLLRLLKCLLVKELYLLKLLWRHARQSREIAGAESADGRLRHGRRWKLNGLVEANAALAHGSIPGVQLKLVGDAFLTPHSSSRTPQKVEPARAAQIVFRKIVSVKLLPLVNWIAYNTAQYVEA
jgi:hypothetical protein